MMRSLFIVACLVVVACGDDAVDDRTASGVPATESVPTPEERAGWDGFAVLSGGDTVLIERYSRTASTLQGELRGVQDSGRITYQATLGAERRITRIELAVYTAGATQPRQRATGEFHGDTLVGRVQDEGQEPRVERVPSPSGTMLTVANSMATIEQLLRASLPAGGGSVEVPVMLVGRDESQHEVIERVRISRIGSDSVHVVLGEQDQLRLALDGQGRILGGVNSVTNARVARLH